ncbi:MAG: response regulator, partial [Alphaproteobacteria bacterium]|nr:response regulator [Alphaproteobacteria bacterium]
MQRGIEYRKLKILLVEDEVHTRLVIKSLLHQIGVGVIIEATNGRDGLVEVLRENPHLVLCDVHMKPVNGLEFLEKLREIEGAQTRKTPVIFLTGDAKRDTVLFAKEHAVNG